MLTSPRQRATRNISTHAIILFFHRVVPQVPFSVDEHMPRSVSREAYSGVLFVHGWMQSRLNFPDEKFVHSKLPRIYIKYINLHRHLTHGALRPHKITTLNSPVSFETSNPKSRVMNDEKRTTGECSWNVLGFGMAKSIHPFLLSRMMVPNNKERCSVCRYDVR